jgi:hypothetical protein
MGHIAPEITKEMVSNRAIDGIELNLASMMQQCNSCKYAKATRKPIKKDQQTPIAAKFGDEIVTIFFLFALLYFVINYFT